MKTSTAIVAHNAVGALQLGALTGSFVAPPGGSAPIPWWAQLLIQIGLMFGQGVLARENSNTDPNGNPLPRPQ